MNLQITLLFSLFCLSIQTSINDNSGAEIFFKTNLDEMQDAPLIFTKPLPSWLQGTLIRNGLGRFEVGSRKFKNALDAYGKLASWKFPGNGSAFFSTKMVYTESYNQSLAIGDIAPYMLLDQTDPVFNAVQEIESFRNGLDNMNVNIFNFSNEFTIMSDYWPVYQVDPHSLDTIKKFNPPIPNAPYIEYPIVLSSAHPLPEYGRDSYITFVSVTPVMPEMKPKLMIYRITSAGGREMITTVDTDRTSYMHSYALTENYVIIIGVPFYVNAMNVIKTFQPLDAFDWNPNDVTQMYVVSLKTGAVKVLKTENMFFLHTANAYESDLFNDEIIIDVCTYTNTSGLHGMELSKIHNPAERARFSQAALKRYTLDLKSESVNVFTYQPSSPSDVINNFDFPTINENYRSKKYCYVYGIVYNYDFQDMLHMAMVKKDVCEGKNELTYAEEGKLFNEALFVPNPNGKTEDDGVVIMPILDADTQTTNITVFDAKDFSIVSTARLPTNIPFGTHGRFFENLY